MNAVSPNSDARISVLTGDTEGVELTRLDHIICGCTLQFKLPPETAGTFTVALTGQIKREGDETLTDIEQDTAIVNYDTRKTIDATYGDIVYQNGEVRLPITFPENLRSLEKTHFAVNFSESKSRYLLYGADTDFMLALRPPRNRTGEITVLFAKKITKANGINVAVNAESITIPYPEA